MTDRLEAYPPGAEEIADGTVTPSPGPEETTKGAKVRGARLRRVLFTAFTVLFSLFLLAAFNILYLLIVLYWLPDETILSLIPDFDAAELVHRLHGMALATFVWGIFIGTVVQLRHPQRRLAPFLMALAVPVALIVGELVTGTYTVGGTAPVFVPLLLIAALHPHARKLLAVPGLNRPLAGLIAVAAVPLLLFAAQQAQMQRLAVPGDTHAEMGHWAHMVSFALLILLWGLIGASDHPGWRLVAWVAGLAAAIYGLQSLFFPTMASAAPVFWAAVVVVWAAAYLALTERRARRGA
ncbi:MAG TPA: hypothetical protein VK879_15195 [Candidatus Sulfomarinibacteraceae bacterium]|nr:hypothetical protein [Candidatus Sulfomarinibacteraceae bacterium]